VGFSVACEAYGCYFMSTFTTVEEPIGNEILCMKFCGFILENAGGFWK